MADSSLPARELLDGDLIQTHRGVDRVLSSAPGRQSAASGTYTMWCLSVYAEGRPNVNLVVDPTTEFYLVRRGAALLGSADG